jgi:uncharacterized alkaline shock family protein YloU
MLIIAGLVVAMSLGWNYPLDYLNLAVSTPGNRIILGAVGAILIIVILIILILGLKMPAGSNAVIVEKSTEGEVSISIAATKVIIMKAVKQVEGVKELKPIVGQSPSGLTVKLHTMINPEQSVPELAQSLQTVVKDHLEKIGGLQVAEIKVLVDDFNTGSKKGGKYVRKNYITYNNRTSGKSYRRFFRTGS